MDAWRLAFPKRTCGTLCRSAQHYREALAQFDVEHSARYMPRDGATFCNIFLWDATRAMACEIPHWLYGKELNANATLDWLESAEGKQAGWSECDLPEATARAFAGEPVAIVWKNPHGIGHVALGMPGASGALTIAQAGAHNLYDAPIASGFGKLPVKYFTHD